MHGDVHVNARHVVESTTSTLLEKRDVKRQQTLERREPRLAPLDSTRGTMHKIIQHLAFEEHF